MWKPSISCTAGLPALLTVPYVLRFRANQACFVFHTIFILPCLRKRKINIIFSGASSLLHLYGLKMSLDQITLEFLSSDNLIFFTSSSESAFTPFTVLWKAFATFYSFARLLPSFVSISLNLLNFAGRRFFLEA